MNWKAISVSDDMMMLCLWRLLTTDLFSVFLSDDGHKR